MKTALLLIVLSLCVFNVPAQGQQQTRRAKLPQTTKFNSRTPQAEIANPRFASLPIRRVVLYSNGVAYIERRGMVNDHAEISLSFKQSQVDDVLKSMVVLDLGKGRIGAVSYNSSAPASARMAEIPFAISATTDANNGGGLAGVLGQLQGARVIVVTAVRTVVGSILTLESGHSRVDADHLPVVTRRLVISSDNGQLHELNLADIRSVQLVDEGTRRDLTEFAHAAASARRRDAKTIVVTSDGMGEREMVVTYTIAAPIWKTTYRVVLDASGQPFFQGWAIVDNVSEEDWTGIQLSLVSGTPVSFIQPIQNPVYRYRPVIPFSENMNLSPQTYEPGESSGMPGSISGTVKDPAGAAVLGVAIALTNMATNQTFTTTTDSEGHFRAPGLAVGNYRLVASMSGFKSAEVDGVNVVGGRRSDLSFNLEVGGVSETVSITASETSQSIVDLPTQGRNVSGLMFINPGIGGAGGGRRKSLANTVAAEESGVKAEARGSEVGDLFEYRIDQPVTVQRDRSALIPILQTRMQGERVSIFNEQAQDHRPMSGLLLKNTSALTLEDGSLTVVDGDSYAGEALMERLKPAEERLISFALDLGTLINVHDVEGREPTFLLRTVNGVIEAHYYDTRKKIYTLVNQTENIRTVYLEHPIDEDSDWKLAENSTKPETQTASHYRFRVVLRPHETIQFPVTERSEHWDSYQLASFTRPQLEFFIARRYVDEATRAALQTIIDLKDKLAAVEANLQQLNKEAAEITQDQQRLRENITALTSTAEAKQLIARYVAKANEQETRMEQIEKTRKAIVTDRVRLQGELDAAVRSFSIDRTL
ncbi:MAG TPA: carboxypeptidase regulatory-like domain-containing protein [Pyrinomonadaceae bacterium]|nr:carboxypeptidase regulatory-like domain-containing protein [Pyrinomonadaceae bacterium]